MRLAALVLAGGLSRRMAPDNKLLLPIAGAPLVTHAVDAALASRARPVLVVTGYQAEALRAALAGREVGFAHNPDYAEGLASSLRTGIAALGDVDAVVVCLGDMPWVRAAHIDALIAAFEQGGAQAICVPTCDGKRGNPVLWPARYFEEIAALRGDIGARALIEVHASEVREVPLADPAITRDADTPESLSGLVTSP